MLYLGETYCKKGRKLENEEVYFYYMYKNVTGWHDWEKYDMFSYNLLIDAQEKFYTPFNVKEK